VGHVDNWISAWNGDGVGIALQVGQASDYLDAAGKSKRGTGAYLDYTLPTNDPYYGSYTTRDGVRYKWGVGLMSDFYWKASVGRFAQQGTYGLPNAREVWNNFAQSVRQATRGVISPPISTPEKCSN